MWGDDSFVRSGGVVESGVEIDGERGWGVILGGGNFIVALSCSVRFCHFCVMFYTWFVL